MDEHRFEVEAPTITLDDNGDYVMRIDAAGNLDLHIDVVVPQEEMPKVMPFLVQEWHGVEATFRPKETGSE